MRSFRGWIGATALLVGCGGGGGSDDATTASATTTTTTTTSSSSSSGAGTGGTSTAVACTSQPASASLTGTWAAYAELSVKLQGVVGGAITICPADQVGQATLLMLVDIKQNATDPTKLDQIQATLCSIELPTTSALVGTCDPTSQALVSTQLIVPQALIDALPSVANATAQGSLGGAMPGASFSVAALDTIVGSSKGGAALPNWMSMNQACGMTGLGSSTTCDSTCVTGCSSVRDDDGDGYPGVTIEVCGLTPNDTQKGVKCSASSPSTPGTTIQGQGFIDLEVNPALTGTVKSSCEITGNVAAQVVYNLVGANVYLTGAPISVTSAIESLPTFQVDPTTSKFRMVRIDGQYGSWNWMVDPTNAKAACATLNMKANQL
jgi:hypothetical protein